MVKKTAYTRDETIRDIAIGMQNWKGLYKNKVVYRTGRTSDSSELYTEIMAQELLKKVGNLYTINKITRKESYYIATHTGEPDSKAQEETEKLLAIDLFKFGKEFDYIGKIFDYEVPLKNSNGDKDVGKIDLIAKKENTVTLLELKAQNSKETLLRCVLEVFTYWKTLDHQKFLYDFKDKNLSQDHIIKKAVLVFEGSSAYKQYHGKEENKNTLSLMKELGVEMFVLHKISEKQYAVRLP